MLTVHFEGDLIQQAPRIGLSPLMLMGFSQGLFKVDTDNASCPHGAALYSEAGQGICRFECLKGVRVQHVPTGTVWFMTGEIYGIGGLLEAQWKD